MGEPGACHIVRSCSSSRSLPATAASLALPQQVFDANSRGLLRQLKGHQRPVHVTRFAPDRLHVLSGGDDALARWWDISTGKQVGKPTMALGPSLALGQSVSVVSARRAWTHSQ